MVRAQDASLVAKSVDNIDIVADPTKLFNDFIQSQTCAQTFSTFLGLCRVIDVNYPPSPSTSITSSSDHLTFYPRLKKKLSAWKAQSIWSKLDKRFFGKEYFVNPKLHKSGGQRAGADTKVLIIGAGPCGLRTAIEMACLGTKVVVLEKRDNFSRNNVLHLWPYIITDLKALGAKKLYGKFCAGAIDHISIRQLQLILLKIALMVGVEVIFNVSFENLMPPADGNNENEEDVKGWTAEVNPSNHSISKYEFDVVVGADGKRNTLKGFKRKEFRGKLAIGLTVNFINRNTTAEAKVEEISGVAYIFNQEFFKGLHRETGIDLENIVYYKGETHYFVMTAKKHSLLSKGVLKQDFDETSKLLSYKNVDLEAMMSYALEAADFSTHHQLPTMDFAINHFGQPDVALFDFTCMYAAENAALFRETRGHKLLSCLVGDSLLEPFWPMGTGCARGFLAAFDTVWMTKQWSLKRSELDSSDRSVELQVSAERESIYRLLHQTTPQNTMKNHAAYTIDPNTRYVNLNTKLVAPHQVSVFYLSDRAFATPTGNQEKIFLADSTGKIKKETGRSSLIRKVSVVRSSKLLSWCRRITDGYPGVHLVDMSSSWKSGLAICALIHRFRPDLINWNDLVLSNVEDNNQLAFDVAEKQLGISPGMTGKEMAETENVDKLFIVTYMSQFYEMFKHETPTGIPPTVKDEETKVENGGTPKSPAGVSLTSPVGLLTRFTQHIKRRSYSVQGKQNDENSKKKKQGTFRKKDDSLLPGQSLEVVHEHQEQQENLKNTEPKSIQIENTTVKLRPKTQPPNDSPSATKPNVHQRASGRISALSNQLISQWEQNAPKPSPRAVKRQVDIPELPSSSVSDNCYFCNRRVYIVERLSAEGHFFHRQCFICSYCGLTLRRGAYEYVKDTGKFFCDATCQAESKSDKYPRKPSADVTETDSAERKFIRRYQTPERIELENMRISMIMAPEDIPEEALARHNFSGSMSRDEMNSPEEDTSDSSDDDIDWEMVLRKASVEHPSQDYTKELLESSIEGYDSPLNNTTMRSWLSDRSYDAVGLKDQLLAGSSSNSEDSDASELSDADNSCDESDSSMLSDADNLSPGSEKSSSAALLDGDDVTDGVTANNTVTPNGSFQPAATAATRDSLRSAKTASQSDVLVQPSSMKPTEGSLVTTETSVLKTDALHSKNAAKSSEKKQEIFTVVSPLIIETTPKTVNDSTKSVENIANQEPNDAKSSRNSSKLSKYDTLDRVQAYLRATPITSSQFGSESAPKETGRQESNSTFISLSSSSESEYHVSDCFDDPPPTEPSPQSGKPHAELRESTHGSFRSTHGSFRSGHGSFRSAHGSFRSAHGSSGNKPSLSRQLSADSFMMNNSRSSRNGTSAWSNFEGDGNMTTVDASTTQKTSELDESLISEYKSCLDESAKKSRASVGRQLSYDSLDRRLKLRLRARNRWLREESKSQKSPSDRGTTPEKSDLVREKPPTPTSTPVSPSSGIVIIEMTPSVDEPLTPSAPPTSRKQSAGGDSDQFYTPLARVSKSPPPHMDTSNLLTKSLDFDVTDEFVSAPTTPDAFTKSQATTEKEMPALPKVPHLEAISPTGSASNTLRKKRDTDKALQEVEERVKRRVEKEKMNKNKSDNTLTVVDANNIKGLDASFSGYSPVPSRKKTSMKKRNKKSKSPKDAQGKHGDNEEKRARHFFRIAPRKKVKKDKNIEAVPKAAMNSRSTLERKYSNQSDREKAILRGERFRITVDRTEPSTSKAEQSDSPDEGQIADAPSNYWSQRRRANLAGLTPEQIDAKITRRVQLAARRQARIEAQKRLRRAQVIQRQLEEIEVKQKDVEERGVELEKLLRVDGEQKEESSYMQDWFKLIQEKNALLRYENELMIHQRGLQLEDVQSRLQQELRERMALDDKNKSSEELQEEKEILQKMLDVVEQRDELVALLEEQRIKERDEFVDSETLLLNKFDRFPESSWSAQ